MFYVIAVINILFQLYYLLIILRVIVSWLPHSSYEAPFNYLYALTEPILGILRQALPPTRFGFDFSPVIALIFIWVLHQIILRLFLLI